VHDDLRPACARDLIDAIDEALPRLLAMDEAAAAQPPVPGKWSPKQIIGHLIDSASNNHQRFVRAQFRDDLVFDGYEQDRWVARQCYDSASWLDLVALWRLFNLHLAHVMSQAGETERLRPRARHNLDRIAFRTVPASETTTLDYLMRDYVDHLRHHLAQIDAATIA
jgi:hypothetical protein